VPPAVVVLGLVAIGLPAGARAVFGRPRSLRSAWLLAAAAAATAQVLGELAGASVGLLGDAQLLLAIIAGAATVGAVAVAEGPAKR
jgi:hypothetical protein